MKEEDVFLIVYLQEFKEEPLQDKVSYFIKITLVVMYREIQKYFELS